MKNKSFKDKILNIWAFLTVGIWRITENELSKSKRLSILLLKKLILSLREFFEDNLMIKASALTYNTLLAIVPILALIIAIGKGFGVQNSIENFVSSIFATNQELLPYIMNFVSNYLDQAHGGLFVGIGIAVLLWSVMSMFRQIENNFNDVWNVKKSRSFIRQFTTYFSLMLLVPVLIVIATSLSNMIDPYIEYMTQHTENIFLSGVYKVLITLLPFFIYWILFTIIFIIIPNTKVGFMHALFAGIVAGTLFQIFQYLYITGQINLTKYNAVYGSFAFLPLLLFWLQISWVIVLYGAKLSYVSQNIAFHNFEKETKHISRRFKDYATIIVLKEIIVRFDNNESPVSDQDIANKYNIPIKLTQDILALLTETNIVRETYIEHINQKTYVPALDTHKITLALLIERIENIGNENFKLKNYEESNSIWQKMVEVKELHIKNLQSILVKDL
ncbi:MAG: YihY/virulence factor BrkB family protein [Paludibacteraceae bacterium]|nr:YihY/virulence factor BrkB family protein [Paludibacteraceae bacterium]